MLSSLIISLMVVSSLHSTEAIKDYTIYRAMENGVHPSLPLAIIKAESGFEINAKNKGSTASGLAQYINGTFKGFCIEGYELTDTMSEKNNPYVQIECMIKMLSEKNGVNHWSESKNGKYGWGRMLE